MDLADLSLPFDFLTLCRLQLCLRRELRRAFNPSLPALPPDLSLTSPPDLTCRDVLVEYYGNIGTEGGSEEQARLGGGG